MNCSIFCRTTEYKGAVTLSPLTWLGGVAEDMSNILVQSFQGIKIVHVENFGGVVTRHDLQLCHVGSFDSDTEDADPVVPQCQGRRHQTVPVSGITVCDHHENLWHLESPTTVSIVEVLQRVGQSLASVGVSIRGLQGCYCVKNLSFGVVLFQSENRCGVIGVENDPKASQVLANCSLVHHRRHKLLHASELGQRYTCGAVHQENDVGFFCLLTLWLKIKGQRENGVRGKRQQGSRQPQPH